MGWFKCDGSLVPIDQYQPLYQLLGTYYGGDGVSSFGLPNLNGRVPLGVGQGQGLSPYTQGQVVGTESVSLLASNTPPHTHSIAFSASAGTAITPKGAQPMAVGALGDTKVLPGLYADGPGTVALRRDAIAPFVGGQPHENRQPFLVLNYIIAYAGIYPSQN